MVKTALMGRKIVDEGGNLTIAGGNQSITATIANGESVSAEIDIMGYNLLAIQMPAAWTTANLTFQASSATGGTFNDVYDDAGSEVTVTAAVSRVISLDSVALKLAPMRYIKIRSGTTATPVAQGGARSLVILAKG